MMFRSLLFLLAIACTSLASKGGRWHPCIEVKRDLRVPCECAVTISGSNGTTLALQVDCDRAALAENTQSLREQPVISFSQRSSGYRELPASLLQLLPDLEVLDLSDNSIHRLQDGRLKGLRNLRELRLAHNLLGDSLNPIFSSNEFHDLSNLRTLDVSSNGLQSLEEGIFKGCTSLRDLYLDDNEFSSPPINSLKGPEALRLLSLAANDIEIIRARAFSSLRTLRFLDLSDNELAHIEDDAFAGMTSLSFLNISNNQLHHLNSDVFKGVPNLQSLDVSTNFLREFPTEALWYHENLQLLNLSNNLISELHQSDLQNLRNLKLLDLSRNNIGRLGENVFATLVSLVHLDLSLNSLRAIEESAFEGLHNLQWLSLQDNNILLVPTAALTRLSSLNSLLLDFNRITALSSEILGATAASASHLSLARNLIHDLPTRLFIEYNRLSIVDLSGNRISAINQHHFAGLEDTLIHLDLSDNRLTSVGELRLQNLKSLNLAKNYLKKISPETWRHLDRITHLNISDNPLFGGFPPAWPSYNLISLDASRTGLQVLPAILLLNLKDLEVVSLSGNRLRQLEQACFKNLRNLTSIDLSFNEIQQIDEQAFIGLRSLNQLNLSGNRLSTFTGAHFNTGTGLEVLDLSNNELQHLSPTAFFIHPRLRKINLSGNLLSAWPSELIRNLPFLRTLDLSNNQLEVVKEFSFAQVPHLRELVLSDNNINVIDELAFHNSTQLQRLDISRNKLESLGERTLEGILRMEYLNLMDNRLSNLPERIFEASKLRCLESINLAGNRFAELPTKSLSLQAHCPLTSLNVARNRLSEIFSQAVVNSVKHLDLSQNPLSARAVRGLLGEAKVLRSLDISSCAGAAELSVGRLEAPFLRSLNLSNNNLGGIEKNAFERTTLLEQLDVSRNRFESFDAVFHEAAPRSLRSLDVSKNGITSVNDSSLLGLENLRSLDMSGQANCTRISKAAFKSLNKLETLRAFDFPKLGYLDVPGIVQDMKNLRELRVEVKDISISNEQLSIRSHPRMEILELSGERVHNVSTSILVGTRVPRLSLGLKNTHIDSIPSSLFFPVPRSTHIELDVSGSRVKSIPQQLIATLEERSSAARISGLNVEVNCDCKSLYLWQWCRKVSCHASNSITCTGPYDDFKGHSLMDLMEKQLLCGTNATRPESTTSPSWHSTSQAEPEIIWTVATQRSTKQQTNNAGETQVNTSAGVLGSSNGNSSGGNTTEDTLILGIVGGVVAFIAIVIIIICICRLHTSRDMNERHMQSTLSPNAMYEASVIRSLNGGKLSREGYVNAYDAALANSSATLSSMKMLPYMQPIPYVQSNMQPPQALYAYQESTMTPISLIHASQDRKSER